MADDLLDNYNPLYDVHLQQYFASPHMQKHLRSIGLLRDNNENELNNGDNEVYARHNVMMNMLLKNREKQLSKLAALQKKLDAAEKVEICRKIRSGQTPGAQARARPSRSLSRGRKAGLRSERRSSTSTDEKDWIRKIENESEETPRSNSSVYGRLSASVGKYRYLHKLDDYTLSAYMEELRKQLRRLERFRDVSFGPHSVARHPSEPQESWFFRRRSSSKPRSSRSTSKKRNEPVRVQRPKQGEDEGLEVVGTTAMSNERNKPRETVKTITKKAAKTKTTLSPIKRKPPSAEVPLMSLEMVGSSAMPPSDTFVKMEPEPQYTAEPPEDVEVENMHNEEEIGSDVEEYRQRIMREVMAERSGQSSPQDEEVEEHELEGTLDYEALHEEEHDVAEVEEPEDQALEEPLGYKVSHGEDHDKAEMEKPEQHESEGPLEYKITDEEEHDVVEMEEVHKEDGEKPAQISSEIHMENDDEESTDIRSEASPRPDSAISPKSIEEPNSAVPAGANFEQADEALEEAEIEIPTKTEAQMDQKKEGHAEIPSEDEATHGDLIRQEVAALLEAVPPAVSNVDLYSSETDRKRDDRNEEDYTEHKLEEQELSTASNRGFKDTIEEADFAEVGSENEEEIQEKTMEIKNQAESSEQGPESIEEKHCRAKRSVPGDETSETADEEIVHEEAAVQEYAAETPKDVSIKSSSEHDNDQEDNDRTSPATQSEQDRPATPLDSNKIQDAGVQDLPEMLVTSEMKMASVDDAMSLENVEEDVSESEGKPRVFSPSLPETLEDGTSLATEREPLTKDKWDEILSERPDDYIVVSQTAEENAADKPPNGFETALSDLLTSDHNGSAESQIESGELENEASLGETNAGNEELEIVPPPVTVQDLEGSKEIDTFAILSSPQQGELHPPVETEESEIVEAQTSTPFFEGTVTAPFVAEDNEPEQASHSAEGPHEASDDVSIAAPSPVDADRKLFSGSLEVSPDVDSVVQIEDEKQVHSPVIEEVEATLGTLNENHSFTADENLSSSHPEELTENFYAKETFEEDENTIPEEISRLDVEEEVMVKQEAFGITQAHISEESSRMQDQAAKEEFRPPSAKDEEENTSTDTEGADEDVPSDYEAEKSAHPAEEAADGEKMSHIEASIVSEIADEDGKHSPSERLDQVSVEHADMTAAEETTSADATGHDAFEDNTEEHHEEESESQVEDERENAVIEPEEPIESAEDARTSDFGYEVITTSYSEVKSNESEIRDRTNEEPNADYMLSSNAGQVSQPPQTDLENVADDAEDLSHTASNDHHDEHRIRMDEYTSLETHTIGTAEENGASFGKTSTADGASDEDEGEKDDDAEESDTDSILHTRVDRIQENVFQYSANGIGTNGKEINDENERTPSKAESLGGMAQVNEELVNGKENGAIAEEHLIETISKEHINGTGESKI